MSRISIGSSLRIGGSSLLLNKGYAILLALILFKLFLRGLIPPCKTEEHQAYQHKSY